MIQRSDIKPGEGWQADSSATHAVLITRFTARVPGSAELTLVAVFFGTVELTEGELYVERSVRDDRGRLVDYASVPVEGLADDALAELIQQPAAAALERYADRVALAEIEPTDVEFLDDRHREHWRIKGHIADDSGKLSRLRALLRKAGDDVVCMLDARDLKSGVIHVKEADGVAAVLRFEDLDAAIAAVEYATDGSSPAPPIPADLWPPKAVGEFRGPLDWRARLVVDSDVSADSPVVKGTRVTVDQVVSLVVDGTAWADILRTHPEITEDDLRACLSYAVEEDTIGAALAQPAVIGGSS